MPRYNVLPVHKISPRDSDAFTIRLHDKLDASPAALGTLLRSFSVLAKGESIRSVREEGQKTVIFPAKSSVWHSIIISPLTD